MFLNSHASGICDGRAEELRTLRPELHRLHGRGLDARLSGMQTSQDQSPRDVISLFGKPLSHRERR